jgi:membrane associated rhomboid family serine protease
MSMEYRDEVPPEVEQEAGHAPRELRMPIPVYTIVILVCISAAMIAQVSTGLERSILIAGFVKQAFLFDGEYWRILTGAVIHGSFLHVFMNGYAMYSFGKLVELLANRAHLAIVFLLSAIGGGLLSLFFSPEGISVGASGGIIGLIGYLVVYAFRRRQFISAEFRKSLLVNIGFILIFGFVLFGIIDNYGHIGGLVTGITYGLIQIPTNEYVDPRAASPVTKILGGVALAVYVVTSVFAIFLLVSIR